MKRGIFILLVAIQSIAFAQPLSELRDLDSIPLVKQGLPLDFPWTMGLHNAQFSAIHLNQDTLLDLFVFDRIGNAISTFINTGEPGVSYQYAPEYIEQFPSDLENWVLLRDFNNDGKMDIFSSVPSGIKVYTNTTTSDTLSWELYTPLLLAEIYGNLGNLYVNSINIPSIEDIDGDGDLDILSFDNFFPHTWLFENTTTDIDTMEFVRLDNCWGAFQVHILTDSIWLGQSCKRAPQSNRHFGEYNMLAIDLDGDNVKDLLLSDSEKEKVWMLSNGGDQNTAQMTSVDYSYPSNNVPIEITRWPSFYYLDMDNDGVKDIVAAPSSMFESKSTEIWYYKNNGTNSIPNFAYERNNLFIRDMLDLGMGSHPVYGDISGDSIPDLLIGNYGYHVQGVQYNSQLAYLKNTGTADTPSFELQTVDYMGMSNDSLRGLHPELVDIDGDGDLDLFLGDEDGGLQYYQNQAPLGSPANFVLAQQTFYGIYEGPQSAPCFADLNGDTLYDLVIGNGAGDLSLFLNQGTQSNPLFSNVPTVENWGGIQYGQPGYEGYLSPDIIHDPLSDSLRLILGTRFGDLHIYGGIEDSLYGELSLIETKHLRGERLSPEWAQLNPSDSLELIVGNQAGGTRLLGWYEMVIDSTPVDTGDTGDTNVNIINPIILDDQIQIFPNPGKDQLSILASTVGDIKYEVYDLTGKRMVASGTLQRRQTLIQTASWEEGVYLISLRQGEQRILKKWIKI